MLSVVYFVIGGILPLACGKNLQNPEGAGREADAAPERTRLWWRGSGLVIINDTSVDGSANYG